MGILHWNNVEECFKRSLNVVTTYIYLNMFCILDSLRFQNMLPCVLPMNMSIVKQ